MRGNTAFQVIGLPVGECDARVVSLEAARADCFAAVVPPNDGGDASAEQLRRELAECRARLSQMHAMQDRYAETLRDTRSELRLVSAALMTSQEMERKRIAGELHDSIGQSLGALGLIVGGALDRLRAQDASGAEQMLLRAAEQSRQAIGEVRRIAMDLRPALLDNLGIVGTLSWFCREFRSVHADLTMVTDIDVDEAGIPATLTTAIYRVVQEACHNVVRHARASEIRIVLRRTPGAVELRIDDDGCGLRQPREGDACRSGMGLRSMRDRVEFSGGRFRIVSEAGAGTRIVASWPLTGAWCVAHAADAAPALVTAE